MGKIELTRSKKLIRLNNCSNRITLLLGKSALSKIEKFNPDVLIVPWWYFYLSPSYYYFFRKFKNSCKILVICHNVHMEYKQNTSILVDLVSKLNIDRFFTKLTLLQATYFVVPSEREKNQLQSFHKNAKIMKILHPIYSNLPTKYV